MAMTITQQIPALGGTFSFDPSTWYGEYIIYLQPETTPMTLLGDVVVQFSADPPADVIIHIVCTGDIDPDIYSFTIPGKGLTATELIGINGISYYFINESGDYLRNNWSDINGSATISGLNITDESLTLNKLEDVTAGRIILGNSSNRPTATAVSGDITITSAGVVDITSGAIVNADINASAAIARSKIANGTASHVVINSGAGALSSEAQLANSRGGTGQDTSSSTGFAKVSAGTWSVGSIDIDRDLPVSFEAGETGDFKIKMGFAGTLSEIYAYATKVIAGSDNGTITPKNNAGTTMTSGTITFTAGDPRGTAYTSTPSANNTFVAGDILTFTTAKGTSGGKVHLSLKFTRTS